MRVLVVGAIQGGTVPLTSAVHRGFQAAGAESDLLDFSDRLPEFMAVRNSGNVDRNARFILQIRIEMAEKVSAFRPDVLLGLAQSPLSDPGMLTGFRKAGIKLCYWFMEDYALFEYWKKIAPFFDRFFIIQKDPFYGALRQIGCDGAHYLPLAYDPAWGAKEPDEKDGRGKGEPIAVSFVGAPYPNRVHFLRHWDADRLEIYGEGWEKYRNPHVVTGNRRITEGEARSVYRRSRINLNLHSSALAAGFTGGDFVNPRTFELAGLGAFQLLNMRRLLTLHFHPADETIALNSWEDMKSAADYFLRNDSERQAVAERARCRVLREHTYRHRAEEILSLLG